MNEFFLEQCSFEMPIGQPRDGETTVEYTKSVAEERHGAGNRNLSHLLDTRFRNMGLGCK